MKQVFIVFARFQYQFHDVFVDVFETRGAAERCKEKVLTDPLVESADVEPHQTHDEQYS
jgi:hypothetical protein